jgi:hypothetical protein
VFFMSDARLRVSQAVGHAAASVAELLEPRRMLAEISSMDLEGASFNSVSSLVDNGYTFPHTGQGNSYIESGGARAGTQSLRTRLRPNTTSNTREEFYISQSSWDPGETRWMGMSMKVPVGMPTADSFFIVSQLLFQQSESSPPIHMTVEEINGQQHYILKNLGPGNVTRGQWTTPASPGQWKDFVFHIKASGGSDGFLKAWVNGVLWADYTGPTIKNATKVSTTRIGLYKGPDDSEQNIQFDEVRVHDAAGSYSAVAPGGAQQPGDTAPAAPSGLGASAASSSSINLNWSDNASNETGFEIQYKASSSSTWLALATKGSNATSHTATGLLANTAYDFRVRATNSVGASAWSNTASATTQSGTSTGSTIVASEDAYVRGGTYGSTNYGSDTTLSVKNDANDSYDRQSYLKFNLGSVAASVSSARLKLKVAGTDLDTATTNYQVYLVANDAWSESTLTWNTRPATSTLLASFSNVSLGQVLDLDLTSAVNGQLADDVLSLAIVQVEAGSKRLIGLASSESTTAADRPSLVITP